MLKNGNLEHKVMVAPVQTDFMNNAYLSTSCQTPIRSDKTYSGSTCGQIEHAGQGYYNYQRYLAYYDMAATTGNTTTDQKKRQPGFGLLYDNTTVTGQWINVINTQEVSKAAGRVINNVSLAMPHAGVFAAARDRRNDILQPEELNSEGTYTLRASVPSPVLHVLCANMNSDELKPIVYSEWTDNVFNVSKWSELQNNATTTNKTVVDDIFGWNDVAVKNYPPVFAKYPSPYNGIMNHTSLWGRDAIYLLAQGGPADFGPDLTGTFALCRINVQISSACSTRHNVTGTSSTMEALCEDNNDLMAYQKSQPDAESSLSLVNWKDVGTEWSNAMSLNTGINDGNASNTRLLSQLILSPSNSDPKNLAVDLNPALPSIGEALAVMSGCTLLKGMISAPFVMFWVSLTCNKLTLPPNERSTTDSLILEPHHIQYHFGP